MEFDWDAQKAATNLAKHQLAFSIVYELDWSAAVVRQIEGDFGEPRWAAAFQRSDDERLFVVFTRRGGIFRIISVRHAHEEEFREWLE